MAFEIKPAEEPGFTGHDPRESVLPDEDWQRVISLARRHGFDPNTEYEDVLFPNPGEDSTLTIAATQELAVALSEALRHETAPGGEGEIRVGPPDEPDQQVEWATVRGVGEAAESGQIQITKVA